MSTPAMDTHHPALPNKKDRVLAQKSVEVFTRYTKPGKATKLTLAQKKGEEQEITLPPTALNLLVDILSQMAEGHAVTLLPVHAELTTQEAADLLNVSRPYLIKLLDSQAMPHRKVGKKRRIRTEDVLRYKTAIDNERLKTLDALAKQAQSLDMGYE